METFTFLFTDIEGSTALLRRLREGPYAQALADHRSLIRSGLTAHRGREVDTQGDGLFAVFSSPSACLAAVIDLQKALESHAWPAGEHVRVRMGRRDARRCRRRGVAGRAGRSLRCGLDRTGEPWQQPEERYRRESLAQVHAHLGEEQSERDYARGMTLSSEDILDLASRKG